MARLYSNRGSKKHPAMKNKIIIEGFWNIGKSTLAQILSQEFGYSIIKEPDHLKNRVVQGDIDQWYIAEHLNNQKLFFKNESQRLISERSILSSAAFLYAKENKNVSNILKDFILYYQKSRPLIVFLYAEKATIRELAKNIQNFDVEKLLQNELFIERYEAFFKNILPFVYGIIPIFIKIDKAGKRKIPSEIKNDIIKVFECDRLAQVNIVCFKSEKEPLFLLLKRNPMKGGFWQTITGGVKINQTLGEALLSELKEELNLKLRPNNLLSTQYSFCFMGTEGYELNEYVFGYRLKKAENFTLSIEHTDYQFVSIRNAGRLLKYENNKEAVKKVYEVIKKHREGVSHPML